jgi:hypothetical protein
MTKDQVAQIIVAEAKRRNHTRDECLAEMSALYQESGWDETIWDPTHVTYGVAQQDGSYPNRFNGAAAQVAAFFDKLDAKRASPGHGDIWLNICWLQQAPNWSSAQYWWDHGRQAYLTEIKSRIATVTPYLDKYWTTTEGDTNVPVQGDPTWLEDVLRPVLGDKLKTLDGWKTDGVGGTMGVIWGVVWHHTGNAAATAESISVGRPDLAGPLSQLHIAPDGTVTIVAVGPCNHAGAGSWVGLPTDAANNLTIGIECAWPKNTALTEATAYQENWPDAQMDTMLIVGAALAQHLGYGVGHNISHSEWARFGPAGYRQGKWDPGHLDMDWFREKMEETRKRLYESGPPPVATPPPAVPVPDVAGGPADDQLTYRWNQLGGQTLVEAVAEVRDKVLGTTDRGKPGVKTVEA